MAASQSCCLFHEPGPHAFAIGEKGARIEATLRHGTVAEGLHRRRFHEEMERVGKTRDVPAPEVTQTLPRGHDRLVATRIATLKGRDCVANHDGTPPLRVRPREEAHRLLSIGRRKAAFPLGARFGDLREVHQEEPAAVAVKG
jgi:hypothetical protein